MALVSCCRHDLFGALWPAAAALGKGRQSAVNVAIAIFHCHVVRMTVYRVLS